MVRMLLKYLHVLPASLRKWGDLESLFTKGNVVVQHMRIGPRPRPVHQSGFLRGDRGERRNDHGERERVVVVDPSGGKPDRVCFAGTPEKRQMTSVPNPTVS